jgi:hypothetical protein
MTHTSTAQRVNEIAAQIQGMGAGEIRTVNGLTVTRRSCGAFQVGTYMSAPILIWPTTSAASPPA